MHKHDDGCNGMRCYCTFSISFLGNDSVYFKPRKFEAYDEYAEREITQYSIRSLPRVQGMRSNTNLYWDIKFHIKITKM